MIEHISIACTENLNAKGAKESDAKGAKGFFFASFARLPLRPLRLILFSFPYTQLKCALGQAKFIQTLFQIAA
jgi:hypothetical protein